MTVTNGAGGTGAPPGVIWAECAYWRLLVVIVVSDCYRSAFTATGAFGEAMRDDGGGGDGSGTSVDEAALGRFVDTSEHLAGELTTRLAEAGSLDRRVRNLSTDFAPAANPLDEATALAVRWATAAASVERIRNGTIAADQFVPDPGADSHGTWTLTQPIDPEAAAGLRLGHQIQTGDPDLGLDLGRHIQTIDPDSGLDLGILIQTGDPDLGLGTEIQGGDDERTLQHLAKKRPRAPVASEPIPSGPVTRPTDPYALVPVNGKLYPAHQVTFWPTGQTTPAGPDGKPQPLYTTKLLGEGGAHVDNNTLINTDAGRIWHLDVENPSPGQRPGQLHLQYKVKGRTIRHMYDFNTSQFLPSKDGDLVPRAMENEIRRLPDFSSAIDGARDWLNAPPVKP